MENNKMIQIDNYYNEFVEKQEFSGSVLVAQGDNIIINKGYGISNHDLDVANTTNTKFCIASITKSITGMAIAILADQKKLNIEDTLDKYIPDYPNGDKITIYHLVTHTSGVCEIYKLLEKDIFGYQNNTLEDLINKYKHEPLDFEPGEKFQYSNLGYSLLAYIIEKVSGKTYEQFIKENIFDKLSMTDTGCYKNEHILKNKANGYTKSEARITNCKSIDFSNICGAGNLYSTVEDMFAWIRGLKSGKLLSEEYSKKLFTDYEFAEENYYYGYGFVIHKPKDEIEYIYQDGGLPGFRTIYMYYPKNDLITIIFSNYDFVNNVSAIEKIEQIVK